MSTERDLDTRGCGKMTDDNSDVSLAIHALQAEMDKLSAEVDRLTAIDLEARGYADMAEAADLRAEAAEKEVAGWKETYDRQAVLMGKYAREAMADKAKLTALVEALEDVQNPLGRLKRLADAKGHRLSGEAYAIANSLAYVQSIARDALAAFQSRQEEK